MALAKNVMTGGVSAGQAQAINGNSVNSSVAGAGTTQATATAITADGAVVTSGGLGSGVILYSGQIGDSQWVYNNQAAAIQVYPPTGGKINQVATNGGATVPQYTFCRFTKVTATQFVAEMSA